MNAIRKALMAKITPILIDRVAMIRFTVKRSESTSKALAAMKGAVRNTALHSGVTTRT